MWPRSPSLFTLFQLRNRETRFARCCWDVLPRQPSNDAYRRVRGAKHPAALGRPAADVWREIRPAIQPQYDQVRAGGAGLDLRDVPFTLARRDGGAAEAGWFDYALSPIRGEETKLVRAPWLPSLAP